MLKCMKITQKILKYSEQSVTLQVQTEKKKKEKITDIGVWEQEVSPLGTPESFHQYDSGNT